MNEPNPASIADLKPSTQAPIDLETLRGLPVIHALCGLKVRRRATRFEEVR